MKVLGNFRSRERKFPRTFVPGNESSRELSLPGAKVPGNFRSRERKFSVGNTEERKVLIPETWGPVGQDYSIKTAPMVIGFRVRASGFRIGLGT